MAGRGIAGVRNGQILVVHAVAERTDNPGVILLGEVDAAVVPGVAVCIEAPRGLDGNKR